MNNENVLKKQSVLVDALRFPLIIIVIFIHVLPDCYVTPTLELSVHNGYIYLSEIISHVWGQAAVPCFFLFSGWYAFYSKKPKLIGGGRNKFIAKIIKSLFLPYILWNALYFLLLAAYGCVSNYFNNVALHFSAGTIINDLLSAFYPQPINYPLWYLRDLIGMNLLVPLFFFVFRKFGKWSILLLLTLYFSGVENPIQGFSITALTFFGIGGYLGTQQISLLKVNSVPKLCTIIPFVVGTMLLPFFNQNPLYHYLSRPYILVVIMVLLQTTTYIHSRWERIIHFFKGMSRTVFFIYATHTMLIINWVKGAFSKISWFSSDWGLLVGYFGIGFATLGVSLLLYYVVNKLFPNFLRLSMGGR